MSFLFKFTTTIKNEMTFPNLYCLSHANYTYMYPLIANRQKYKAN